MRLPEPGDLFLSKFRLDGVLGVGGFSKVYCALDTAERPVAIKILVPEGDTYTPETLARFEREVQIVGGLRDPHSVVLYESGTSPDGLLYMVFEFVPGHDLAEVLEVRGRLSPNETIHVLRQVLMALREAHHHGLLHRDIKPENIRLYEYMGDPLRVKLLDFGIARSSRRDLIGSITKTGELVGTPRYMSPEQLLEQQLTPASDIYSLGLVMLETLLGRAALGGGSWSDQFERLRSGHVFSMPELERVGAGLHAVFDRMVARDPSQRLASADAVLHALDELERRKTPAAPSPPRRPRASLPPTTESMDAERRPPTPTSTRALLAWSAAALFGVGVAGVILNAALDESVPPRPPPASKRPLPTLVKGAMEEPVEEPTADRENEPDDAAATVANGCGNPPPFTGTGEITRALDLVQTSWFMHIPEGYDPQARHPVVIMLHQDHTQPDTFIGQTGFDRLADAEGFVVLAPTVGELRAWDTARDIDVVRAAYRLSANELCLDPKRVFVLGHNNAGKAVERLSCEPWVTAVATSSYRPNTARFLCSPARPIPFLALSPLQSGHMPVAGGVNCYGSEKLSLEAFDEAWRVRNGCTGEAERHFRHAGSTCRKWSCEAPFISCHLDGGQNWPGWPVRVGADWLDCDGPETDFPSGQVIWDFFESVTRDEQSQ